MELTVERRQHRKREELQVLFTDYQALTIFNRRTKRIRLIKTAT